MPTHQDLASKKALQKNGPFSTRLSAKIDWLEFTVKGYQPVEIIKEILRLDDGEFEPLAKGRFGYKNQEKWSNGNLFVLYNAIEERQIDADDAMGVHIIMSGTGCTSYNAEHTIMELIMITMVCPEHKFTRIDIAIDDIGEKLLKFDRIHKQAIRRNYVTRWNKWDEVLSRQTSDSKFIGQTIYFGSQSSEVFCRVYNKALEQQAKNKDKSAANVPKHWTRMEMIYRRERAHLVAQHLMRYANIGEVIKGTLQSYLRFVKPTGDSNKSRRPMIWWWERFISEAAKLRLTVTKKTKSIEEMEHWIQTQIAPTLATIMAAKGGELDWLYSSMSSGRARMKRKHLEAITRYTKEEA